MSEKDKLRKVDKVKVEEMSELVVAQEKINTTFERMRGKLFCIIEASIESVDRAKAVKILVKEATGDAWTEISRFILTKLQHISEPKEEKK